MTSTCRAASGSGTRWLKLLLIWAAFLLGGANGAGGAEAIGGNRGGWFDSKLGFPGEGPEACAPAAAPECGTIRRRLRGKQRPPDAGEERQQVPPAVSPGSSSQSALPGGERVDERRVISIFQGLAANWQQQARTKASDREASKGIEIYYANVSS